MGVSSPSYFINHIIKNKKNMKNLIIVPFDLNTARKIKSGEIEGSVLIDNIEIEFVYESKDCADRYNLLFVKKRWIWNKCYICRYRRLCSWRYHSGIEGRGWSVF
jgi:hypothetical protein